MINMIKRDTGQPVNCGPNRAGVSCTAPLTLVEQQRGFAPAEAMTIRACLHLQQRFSEDASYADGRGLPIRIGGPLPERQ